MVRGEAGGFGDFHSHLIPGVDDGARDLDDAMEGVRRMVDAGVRRVVTTPHLDASISEDPDILSARLEEVRVAWEPLLARVTSEHPELDFRRGFEIMLNVPDANFSEEELRLGGTSFVLVEWPRSHLPPGTTEVLSRLRFAGMKPVVAHPERYVGMDRELELAAEWRRAGAYLQVNYGSLLGRYGGDARTTAFRLLRRGWVDYFSTYFHGRPSLSLYLEEAFERLEEMAGAEQIQMLARSNPARLLRDEEPLPVRPLPGGRGFWDRVKELFNLTSD